MANSIFIGLMTQPTVPRIDLWHHSDELSDSDSGYTLWYRPLPNEFVERAPFMTALKIAKCVDLFQFCCQTWGMPFDPLCIEKPSGMPAIKLPKDHTEVPCFVFDQHWPAQPKEILEDVAEWIIKWLDKDTLALLITPAMQILSGIMNGRLDQGLSNPLSVGLVENLSRAFLQKMYWSSRIKIVSEMLGRPCLGVAQLTNTLLTNSHSVSQPSQTILAELGKEMSSMLSQFYIAKTKKDDISAWRDGSNPMRMLNKMQNEATTSNMQATSQAFGEVEDQLQKEETKSGQVIDWRSRFYQKGLSSPPPSRHDPNQQTCLRQSQLFWGRSRRSLSPRHRSRYQARRSRSRSRSHSSSRYTYDSNSDESRSSSRSGDDSESSGARSTYRCRFGCRRSHSRSRSSVSPGSRYPPAQLPTPAPLPRPAAYVVLPPLLPTPVLGVNGPRRLPRQVRYPIWPVGMGNRPGI